MSGKLSEFLLARIAEDEAEAWAAIAERDRIDFTHPPEVPDMRLLSWPDSPVPFVAVGPERVLAECEAKRRIVGECRYWIDEDGHYGVAACEAILRILASVYSNHPDYRDEWRP